MKRPSNQKIRAEGLTTIVDHDNPLLDIVFVHGFTGHPERTWTHQKGDLGRQDQNNSRPSQPPDKISSNGSFGSWRKDNSYTAVYWPRDLVSWTVPIARVLTYGYDPHIRHRLGPQGKQNTVYDIAWDFLVALEGSRRSDSSRPIIFIAHSLGGIVVKEMLRRSSGCPLEQAHLKTVFNATIGIIFFGTPHCGADPRGVLQSIAEKAIKAAGFTVNTQIVNSLLPSAERLKELRDEFNPKIIDEKWIIHSFQEQEGIALLGGNKVVEDNSSSINLPAVEIKEHIGRNHMEMCRFTGFADTEYNKVVHALLRIVKNVSPQASLEALPPLSDKQKNLLVKSLEFHQMDVHHMTIRTAHAKTCGWLWATPQFIDWLDTTKLGEHHGFVWIKGKAGTGKSTILKFAVAHARTNMNNKIIVSFFFNSRGENIEKSTFGLYRSILLQLLERLPKLTCIFDILSLSPSTISANYQWSVESLKLLLEYAITRLGNSTVICFIDALDECNEDEIRDMISFFEHVGELTLLSNIMFHVCFASRHYPYVSIKKGLELALEDQDGHYQDITNYLDGELRIGHNAIAAKLRKEIYAKASGIFMWAVLVVDILNKEYDRGRIHALQQRLQEIPSDLNELFRDILTRDFRNRDELILCIQWVLFAKEPLKPVELYYAVISGVEPQSISKWDCNEIEVTSIHKFILDCSKGLAEITKSEIPTVQFIHESVRDFFLKGNGLVKIWPDLGGNFQGLSHEHLKNCCLDYIKVDIFTELGLDEDLPEFGKKESKAIQKQVTQTFPFMEYAVHHILYHAENAASHDIAQRSFIESLEVRHWIKLHNLLRRVKLRHSQSTNLLYILAENNFAHLIRSHTKVLSSSLETQDELFCTPFFAAFATSSVDATREFLKAHLGKFAPGSEFRELFNNFIQQGDMENRDNAQFPPAKILFKYGRKFKNKAILDLMCAIGMFDIESRNEYERLLISYAGETGDETGVQMLLSIIPVDINFVDSIRRYRFSDTRLSRLKPIPEAAELLIEAEEVRASTRCRNDSAALSIAVRYEREGVVKLLLDIGKVNVNINDIELRRTPLSYAAESGNEAIVKLLLKTDKVKVNHRDCYGWTPLTFAAESGNEAIVKLLLKTDKVHVDHKDHYGRTPCFYAVINKHEAVVELLVRTSRVNVSSKDRLGRNLLYYAKETGNEAITKLLLEAEKVGDDCEGQTGSKF